MQPIFSLHLSAVYILCVVLALPLVEDNYQPSMARLHWAITRHTGDAR